MPQSPLLSVETALAPLTGRLRAWGLDGLTAALLEHGGPLAFLGAQALYAAAPLGGGSEPDSPIDRLAGVLEDPGARLAWARRLGQEADDPA